MRRFLTLLFLPIVIAACGMPEVKPSTRDTSWIQTGVTTRQEVIQHLGQPTSSMTLADSEMVRYGRSPQLSPPPSVPSVVATPQGYMTVTPTATPNFEDRPLWIRFDSRGVVTSFGFDEPTSK